MRNEVPPGMYVGTTSEEPPACDFCGADAVLVDQVAGIPLCGVHAGLFGARGPP